MGGEGAVGFGDGVGEIYGAAGVFYNCGLKAEGAAVEGGEAHAEVVSEAGEEEAGDAALAEVASEAGGSGVVVFKEG